MTTTTKKTKIGAKAGVYRKNGEYVEGRVHEHKTEANGDWVILNLAEKRQPVNLLKVRASQLYVS